MGFTKITGWPITSRTWVGSTLVCIFHSSWPPALPILPISHQPKQNQADSGTSHIKFNPTQVRDVIGHPVPSSIVHFGPTHVDVVVATPGDVGRVPRGLLQVKVLELDFQGPTLRTLDRPPACLLGCHQSSNNFPYPQWRTGSGNLSKLGHFWVVVQLMSTHISLWISCTTTKNRSKLW